MSNRYLRPPQPSRDYEAFDDAPREDVLRFVEWARRFHGVEPELSDDHLAELVRVSLSSAGAPKEDQVGPAAYMVTVTVTKLVCQWHHRFKWRSTARPFPKCIFGHVDQRRCAAAAVMNGATFAIADAPVLPLPGCDSDICVCYYRLKTSSRP